MWSAEVAARAEASPVAAVAWARGRLRELEDRYVVGRGERAALEKEITELSLRFGVLCRFTAYVAVDRSEVVNAGGQVHGIVQPVEQPAGWEAPKLARAAPARALGLRARAMRGATPPASGKPEADAEFIDSFLCEAPKDEKSGDASQYVALDDEAAHADRRTEAPLPRSSGWRAGRRLGEGIVEFKKGMKTSDEKAEAKGRSLLDRLLNLFRGGKKGKSKAAPKPADAAPYRQRLADALQKMRQTAADAAARLAALRELAPTLEAVFTEWTTAGGRDDALRRLGEVAVELRALPPAPADAAVHALWTRTETAVQECLALAGGEAPREGFWK
jgi:hypothetical protein